MFLSKKLSMILIFILCCSFISISAQSKGGITGKVSDAFDGEPLYGANVFIEGTAIGTATDFDGSYRITGLDPGNYILVFRYLGFETKKEEIQIVENRIIQLDISLSIEALTGEEVVVTGQLQGQAAAINQQLSSNTIVNVVSKDKLQELPDANAAESIGRLPGISIERDAGEGTKVVVRGLSPKFNSITVNGERIPATDAEDRSVDLSMISSDMLEGIEVFKALTPDKDGDAVGGTVNFVVKRAPEGMTGNIRFEQGYNDHENDFGNYRGSFSVSDRFFDKSLGVLATGSIQRANRSSDVLDASYDLEREKLPDEESAPIIVRNLNLGDRKETRDRYGASVTLDYELPNGSLMLSSLYGRTERDEVRMRKRYRVEASYVEYWLRAREINTDLFTNTLSGNHDLSFMKLDWRTSYSLSKRDMPRSHDSQFRETGAFTNDLIEDQGPQLIPAGAKNDLDETIFYQDFIDSEKIDDKDFTAQVDFEVPYRLGYFIDSKIKFGGKYRDKSRTRDKAQDYTIAFEIDDIGAENPDLFDLTREQKIKISNFIDPDYDIGEFLNGDYDFNLWLDEEKLDQFSDRFSNRYTDNLAIDMEDYEAGESISAGYLMAEINFGDLIMFLPGFRFERTTNDYQNIWGNTITDDYGQTILVSATDTTGTRTYDEFLPMFHLRIKPLEWFDVRMAVTKSISRPDYFNLVPWERITTFESTIERGNSELKHTTAWNYDMFLSFHSNYGLFTIGGFYKKLKDIDYIRTSRVTVDGKGYTLEAPVNSTSDTDVYGVEVEIQTNLRFLPKPFDGIVISANYSRIESETYFPLLKVDYQTVPPFSTIYIDTSRKATMPGQADHIANLSLGYEKGPFSGRISMIYQGAALQTIGSREELDGYTDSFIRWDFTAQYAILDNLSMLLNVNNITNKSEGAYLGSDAYPTVEEYFGMTADIGLRYKF
ncbi:MAG: TonB-dependent receptor [Ignavibacteria bacterium]